jgi:uncharacterized membrane protein YphA (DoxX/SURF4 family)
MILINKYIVWILRIPLAITFLVHGYPKILDCSGLISMGMPSFLAYLIGPFEFIGALFIILGPLYKDAISRLGSLMIAIIMFGAIFIVHLPQKFVWNQGDGGVEWQVMLLCVSLFLLVKGNEL